MACGAFADLIRRTAVREISSAGSVPNVAIQPSGSACSRTLRHHVGLSGFRRAQRTALDNVESVAVRVFSIATGTNGLASSLAMIGSLST